jgi:chromatin modification-related protein VID21
MNGVNGANGIGMNMNGVNHQAFMQNNQAAMAAYQAAAANGHTSPPPNMYMAQNNAASPSSRPMQMPNLQQQVLQLEQHFKSKNPKLTNEQARNQAMSHISSILARQNAMNSAAGVNGGQQAQHAGLAATANVAATTSPHQYAAMLRQHQQQQAAQQAQAQQAQQTPNASSPGQSSHHRQSSEGATPGAVA